MFGTIRFNLNRKPMRLTVDGGQKLVRVLRPDLGLAGAKYGCREGIYGACTVLIANKQPVPVRGWMPNRLRRPKKLCGGRSVLPILWKKLSGSKEKNQTYVGLY